MTNKFPFPFDSGLLLCRIALEKTFYQIAIEHFESVNSKNIDDKSFNNYIVTIVISLLCSETFINDQIKQYRLDRMINVGIKEKWLLIPMFVRKIRQGEQKTFKWEE